MFRKTVFVWYHITAYIVRQNFRLLSSHMQFFKFILLWCRHHVTLSQAELAFLTDWIQNSFHVCKSFFLMLMGRRLSWPQLKMTQVLHCAFTQLYSLWMFVNFCARPSSDLLGLRTMDRAPKLIGFGIGEIQRSFLQTLNSKIQVQYFAIDFSATPRRIWSEIFGALMKGLSHNSVCHADKCFSKLTFVIMWYDFTWVMLPYFCS